MPENKAQRFPNRLLLLAACLSLIGALSLHPKELPTFTGPIRPETEHWIQEVAGLKDPSLANLRGQKTNLLLSSASER